MTKYKHDLKRNPALSGDRFFTSRLGLFSERPKSMDLRPMLPDAFDQGEEGSCGPNSASGLMCFFNPEIPAFSRQQIYYCTRQLEGSGDEDAGVETKDLFAILTDIGAAPEDLWPYHPRYFKTPPPESVLRIASKYRIGSTQQLVAEEDYLDCLADGFPFILGFECYESTDSDELANTGVMARPAPHEHQTGGHDVLVVGYDTNFHQNKHFLQSGIDPARVNNTALLIRNSWSVKWGIKGHFYMPIDFASGVKTGGDAWTGRLLAYGE